MENEKKDHRRPCNIAQSEAAIRRYEANPKFCPFCKDKMQFAKRWNKFCSHSCSSAFNNSGVSHKKKEKIGCLSCGKETSRQDRRFCSSQCQRDYDRKVFIDQWLAGKKSGVRSGGLSVSNFIKRWCLERSGGECAICHGTQWMGKKMPLILDHIDGNGLNNAPTNLRMICGNCGMQLDTFTGRNRGKGRTEIKKEAIRASCREEPYGSEQGQFIF